MVVFIEKEPQLVGDIKNLNQEPTNYTPIVCRIYKRLEQMMFIFILIINNFIQRTALVLIDNFIEYSIMTVIHYPRLSIILI